MKCAACNQVKKSLCMKKDCKQARIDKPELLEVQATLRIAGKKAASVQLPAPESETDSDSFEDSDVEDNPLACFKVGDHVKVYWSMLDPPAWYNGTVAKIGKARLKIDYPIEDEYQWHDPNKWDIQKVLAIVTAEESDDGDSDDDMSLGALFPK